MRDILKPGIALLVIASVAAGVLGYVNSITAQPIANAELETTKASVKAVLPEVAELTKDDIVAVENSNSDVTSYIKARNEAGETIGYAVSVTTNGFSSGLKLMYGIDTEGKITGVSVIDCSNETPGLGANIKTDADFRNQFVGKEGTDIKVNKDGGDIDSITGATITSRAAANSANAAIAFYNENLKSEGGAE